MKRERKLKPSVFLDGLLFNRFDNESVSLNDYSVDMQIRHEVEIKKQSINERFNANSVKFVRTLLEQQLQEQVPASLKTICLENFTSAKIKDSTRFQLPASLKDAYPGSGGAASEAGAHIQFEFDLNSGNVSTIKVTDAKRTDTTDANETIADVEEGSLIIRDLGYFSTKALEQIGSDKKAYYISRLIPKAKVFRCINDKFKQLDLVREYETMKQSGQQWKELDVFIGEKSKLSVRLLMELMPEDEIEKRLRKANREAEKKGRQLSAAYKAYACLGLFITNVPKQWMEPQHIRSVYRLRWQIELRFKCWKGLCHVHAVKKMKLHRFETCLYACLLYIMIHWEISVNLLAGHFRTTKTILSVYKCFKAVLQCADILRNALMQGIEKMQCYIEKIESINYRNLVLEKRKDKLSLFEILFTDIKMQ